MSAPAGFEGQWFYMKTGIGAILLGPLGMLLFKGKGIGVSEEGLVLKGFGVKTLPWDDVEGIRPLGMGAAGLLLKPFVVDSKSKGTLTLPIHQTTDPAGLVAALEARGFAFAK